MMTFQEIVRRHQDGRIDEAAEAYRAILAQQPEHVNYVDALHLLGVVAIQRQQFEEAAALIGQAIDRREDVADFHHNRGGALRALGDFESAERHYRRAIGLKPDLVEAYFDLANTRRFAQGEELLEQVLRQIVCVAHLPTERSYLHFAAGKLLDDMGEFERAMVHFSQANLARQASFARDEHARKIDQLMEVFDSRFVDTHRDCGFPDDTPVFVVGMPRSGTTLVEQILASHPEAFGAGELHDLQGIADALQNHDPARAPFPACVPRLAEYVFAGFGKAYGKRLRELNATARRIVDKMPRNFQLVGLIAALLPQAKIIHCRRDPLDTCLSCYFQRFRSGHEFAYDWGNLGFYYAQYDRLMQHWHALLPDRLLAVDYEQLVTQPEPQIRRLLGFCELPWSDDCLDFHLNKRVVTTASNWQIRRPIYRSSVQRWRNYDQFLEPLRLAMRSFSPAAAIDFAGSSLPSS